MPQLRRPGPEQLVTFGVVAAASLFVFSQIHPELIFKSTTPAGGDMGAHVWGPAYMRDHLLPRFRLTGWAPDWYAGFPAYQFYFPLPSLLIVILDLLLPYGIAFKVVSILGLVSLPVAAWAFATLAGMRFPGPPVLALATLPFLFDRGFSIYGGNIASTLAGEFSFSISLSLALVFLGLVARGLDTGRNRALAAVVLTLTGLSHLLPTIFAVVGALLLLLLRPGRRRVTFLLSIFVAAIALVAFWALPFLVRLPYANNMGWEKITEYAKNLFPHNLRWLTVLAVAGTLASMAFRRRVGLFLFGMAMVAAALFVLAPEGRLWNARVLPFWYLSLYLLAGVAVTEAGLAFSRAFAEDPRKPSRGILQATPLVAAFAVWMFVGLPLGVIPDWFPKPATTDTSYIPSWSRWNYSGYEAKDAYPEYKSIIDTMKQVGQSNGCGRAHWEYESQQDRFGTPMALMLLPYWTDGCIGSMEGLYFESSATTPYHFLSAGELSKAPSNPQRDLPYRALDIASGVEHLKLLGARYYLAFSPEAVAQAEQHPDLRLVARTGSWQVYEVSGSELVTPLAFMPAVVKGLSGGERPWLDVSVNWFMDQIGHEVPLAASGPKEWPRVQLHQVASVTEQIGSEVRVDPAPRQPVEPTGVRNIKANDNSISFDVDRPGSPVLVKISYFPNWRASGARGPWRVTPNLMVVVPTADHVTLKYRAAPPDVMGWALTLAGLGLVVLYKRRGPVDLDAPPEEGPPPVAERRRREPVPTGAKVFAGRSAGSRDRED
jgi:hypothetical protein